MAFNGTEGGAISLEQGSDLASKWRKHNPDARKGAFMGKEILIELLNQEGCKGIRVYYGLDEDGQMQPVFSGAEANENDLLDLVANGSRPCTPFCGINNPLNS
jgi:hypothetical protein